jgi:hypothetical protein
MFIKKRLKSAAPLVYDYWMKKRTGKSLLRRFQMMCTDVKSPYAAFIGKVNPPEKNRKKLTNDWKMFRTMMQLQFHMKLYRQALPIIVKREQLKRSRIDLCVELSLVINVAFLLISLVL